MCFTRRYGLSSPRIYTYLEVRQPGEGGGAPIPRSNIPPRRRPTPLPNATSAALSVRAALTRDLSCH